jgi:hypothetical protein
MRHAIQVNFCIWINVTVKSFPPKSRGYITVTVFVILLGLYLQWLLSWKIRFGSKIQ